MSLTHPSPNFGPRRGGARPELIVLHYTAMASAQAAIARLCDPAAEVSAHYVISETGDIATLVPEEMRAWHAGAGQWQGREDVNSRSIGIELANAARDGALPPFPEPQMAALETLLPAIMARWAIRPAGVIGHSDLAPMRKSDPGPKFDWERLARRGLSLWYTDVADAPADQGRFLRALLSIGYSGKSDDLLTAFRHRFYPQGQGALTPRDVSIAEAVAAEIDPLSPSP